MQNQTTRRQLLVIEDDLDVQDLMVAFFRPKGFDVFVHEDPLMAIKDIEQKKIMPEVVVTDLMLPHISGIELIKKLKEFDEGLPVILMTSSTSVENAVEAIEAGAYDFVVKPLHFPQLHISVQRALRLRKIESENKTLKSVVEGQRANGVPGVIGKSPGLKNALELAQRISSSTANVLITGESGTGKEVIARAIHYSGDRKKGPFVAINCSAIPETLLEAELFGHAKGAFTGAIDKKLGLFEEAENGILFLDEIGDLSLPLQAKLLRVLQERKIKRVGENNYRPINVRILSATHKDLRKEVSEGRFREDLYFRLNVIPIRLSPLRERKEDILPLAEFFLKKYVVLNQSPAKRFSKESVEFLLSQHWKGNVRELENTIERAAVLADAEEIKIEHLDLFKAGLEEASYSDSQPLGDTDATESQLINGFSPDQDLVPLEDVVKNYILFVLEKNNGAKDKTAKTLHIDRKTLYRKLQEYSIQ